MTNLSSTASSSAGAEARGRACPPPPAQCGGGGEWRRAVLPGAGRRVRRWSAPATPYLLPMREGGADAPRRQQEWGREVEERMGDGGG